MEVIEEVIIGAFSIMAIITGAYFALQYAYTISGTYNLQLSYREINGSFQTFLTPNNLTLVNKGNPLKLDVVISENYLSSSGISSVANQTYRAYNVEPGLNFLPLPKTNPISATIKFNEPNTNKNILTIFVNSPPNYLVVNNMFSNAEVFINKNLIGFQSSSTEAVFPLYNSTNNITVVSPYFYINKLIITNNSGNTYSISLPTNFSYKILHVGLFNGTTTVPAYNSKVTINNLTSYYTNSSGDVKFQYSGNLTKIKVCYSSCYNAYFYSNYTKTINLNVINNITIFKKWIVNEYILLYKNSTDYNKTLNYSIIPGTSYFTSKSGNYSFTINQSINNTIKAVVNAGIYNISAISYFNKSYGEAENVPISQNINICVNIVIGLYVKTYNYFCPFVVSSPTGPTAQSTFTSSGLPANSEWNVTLNGITNHSTTNKISFSTILNYKYNYTIPSVIINGTYYSPSSSSGTILGGQNKSITFSKNTLTFSESGLPAGTNWSVTYNSIKKFTTLSSITFDTSNSSEPYSIPSINVNYTIAGNKELRFNLTNNQTSPSLLPSNVTYYVPIILNNTQSTSTGSNFQQMITIDPSSYSSYERPDLGNIRFYQGSSELYSWCESGCNSTSTSSIFWVKLANGIGSNSKITLDMAFLPTTVQYDGNYAGEAPELSSSYAEYDNGVKVFSKYWNFAGTTLNGWGWTYGSATVTVNNGLTYTGGSCGGRCYYRNLTGINIAQYTETEIVTAGSSSNFDGQGTVDGYGNARDHTQFMFASCGNGYYAGEVVNASSGLSSCSNDNFAVPRSFVGTIVPSQSTNSVRFYLNGTLLWNETSIGLNDLSFSSLNSSVGIVSNGGDGSSSTYTVYVMALGTAAPNGIMPSVTIGSITQNQALIYLSTPAPFQQMITFNASKYAAYERANLGNIRFENSTNSSLYSWCESGCTNSSDNTIFWVKLPNGIGGNKKISIYAVFKNFSTQYDGNYAGEAPQLSSTYGEYDNGANIFPYYQRWGGLSSLPSGWSSSTTFWTFNSKNTTFTSSSRDGIWMTMPTELSSYPYVWDFYGNMYISSSASSNTGTYIGGYGSTPSSVCCNLTYMLFEGYGHSPPSLYIVTDNNGQYFDTSLQDTISNNIYTFWASSSSAVGIYLNYQSKYSTTGITSITTNYFLLSTESGSTLTLYWLRARAYPPNGVMPPETYSFVQINTSGTTTYTPNPSSGNAKGSSSGSTVDVTFSS